MRTREDELFDDLLEELLSRYTPGRQGPSCQISVYHNNKTKRRQIRWQGSARFYSGQVSYLADDARELAGEWRRTKLAALRSLERQMITGSVE